MKSGTIGFLSFVLAIASIVAVWAYDSSYLNTLMDWNLASIKWVAAQIPIYGDKMESALRFLAGEKALILIEFGLVFKIFIKIIAPIIPWRVVSISIFIGILGWVAFTFRESLPTAVGDWFANLMNLATAGDSWGLIYAVGPVVVTTIVVALTWAFRGKLFR